jgi:hypothetical protein
MLGRLMGITEFKSFDGMSIDTPMVHGHNQRVTEKGVPGHLIDGGEYLSVENIANTMRVELLPPEKRHPAVGLPVSKQALQIRGRMIRKQLHLSSSNSGIMQWMKSAASFFPGNSSAKA